MCYGSGGLMQRIEKLYYFFLELKFFEWFEMGLDKIRIPQILNLVKARG